MCNPPPPLGVEGGGDVKGDEGEEQEVFFSPQGGGVGLAHDLITPGGSAVTLGG